MNIYVGNLSYNTTDEALKQAFSAHGEVVSVKVIKDMVTGQSKGFAFVQMATSQEAQAAIEALNGVDLDGRSIRVSEARQKTEGQGNGGSRGGGRDGYQKREFRPYNKPRRDSF